MPATSAQVSLTKTAALARRGLQDLIQTDVRWTRKQVSLGDSGFLKLSSLGQFVTNWKSGSDLVHTIAVYDPDSGLRSVIEAPAFHPPKRFDMRLMRDLMENTVDCFAWSPCGRYLLTESREYSGPLRLYDVAAKKFLGVIGEEPECSAIGWSPHGNYFATAASGCDWPPLTIWRINDLVELCSLEKQAELNIETWFEESSDFFRRYGGIALNMFEGFSRLAFSPNEKTVALCALNRLEFPTQELPPSDDTEDVEEEESASLQVPTIVCFGVPTLRQSFRIETKHKVDSLTWLPSGKMVICSGGEPQVVDPMTTQMVALPFQAEFCCAHPRLDVCAFASRTWPWERFDSDERAFVVDLHDLKIITEEPKAGGICDMSWSADGNTLFAVSAKGDFWSCDFNQALA